MQLAKTDGLRLPRDVANEAVTLLGKERCKPNFGNAGAVETFFGRVKMRLVARDPRARQITLDDVRGSADVGDHGVGSKGKNGRAGLSDGGSGHDDDMILKHMQVGVGIFAGQISKFISTDKIVEN